MVRVAEVGPTQKSVSIFSSAFAGDAAGGTVMPWGLMTLWSDFRNAAQFLSGILVCNILKDEGRGAEVLLETGAMCPPVLGILNNINEDDKLDSPIRLVDPLGLVSL